MATIKIEVPEGKKAEWKNGVLALIDDAPEYGDVRDKIKTFEDAEKATDIYIPQWALEHLTGDIIAYMKMSIIVRALNEGWEPKFIESEYRYFPWYRIYTKEEIDDMDEEDKKDIIFWGGAADNGSVCGLSGSDSHCGWAYAGDDVGARLALKSSELAIYFGRQFFEIIKDFIFITKEENESE